MSAWQHPARDQPRLDPVVTGSAPTAPPVICDLDGVIWLARRAIPGSADGIARLRAAGHRVLFVTNNSFLPLEEIEGALHDVGVPAQGDVLSSAMAAARLVAAGERVLVVGGEGVVQAVTGRGATVVEHGPAEVVMVGFTRAFDFDALQRAQGAILGGARLIGTNDDATYPTPDGPIPGGGSLLAAVATASGEVPVVAGKPHEPMAALVRAEVGALGAGSLMVGDRLETDGAFATQLKIDFGLVRTGVTGAGRVVDPAPAYDAPDLAALVDAYLARSPVG
jgi:4-nitrophenyl phosphatase